MTQQKRVMKKLENCLCTYHKMHVSSSCCQSWASRTAVFPPQSPHQERGYCLRSEVKYGWQLVWNKVPLHDGLCVNITALQTLKDTHDVRGPLAWGWSLRSAQGFLTLNFKSNWLNKLAWGWAGGQRCLGPTAHQRHCFQPKATIMDFILLHAHFDHRPFLAGHLHVTTGENLWKQPLSKTWSQRF